MRSLTEYFALPPEKRLRRAAEGNAADQELAIRTFVDAESFRVSRALNRIGKEYRDRKYRERQVRLRQTYKKYI